MEDLITVLPPNRELVEESHINRWRVFNGIDWVHGFDDKQEAIKFAKKNGGTRIAFFKKIHGKIRCVNPERVELDED